MWRKRSKYGAIRTRLDGYTFDSKAEAERWATLKILAAAGEITGLQRQVPYDLTVNGTRIARYVGDFEYRDRMGDSVVEDVKGVLTPEFRLKAKLMEAIHGIVVQIPSRDGTLAPYSRRTPRRTSPKRRTAGGGSRWKS